MNDLFNRKKLEAALERTESLKAELAARYKAIADLKVELDALTQTKDKNAEDSSVTFYIDKDLVVRMETSVNKSVVDKLVAEGYVSERDISNEEVIHLAFLVMANEVTENIIGQYEGNTVEETGGKLDEA